MLPTPLPAAPCTTQLQKLQVRPKKIIKRNTSPAFEWAGRWKLLWCWPGFGLALLLYLHDIRLFDPKKIIYFEFPRGRGCVESKNMTLEWLAHSNAGLMFLLGEMFIHNFSPVVFWLQSKMFRRHVSACDRYWLNTIESSGQFCSQSSCELWILPSMSRAVTVPGTRYFVRYQVLQPRRNGSSTVQTVPGTTWYFYGTLKRE